MQEIKLKGGKRTVRLGRIRPRAIRTTGQFRAITAMSGQVYYAPRLSCFFDEAKADGAPPERVAWYEKAPKVIKAMLGNDQQGDCVIASALHQIGVWAKVARSVDVIATTEEALRQYHQICGQADQGCMIAAVLDWCRLNGLQVGSDTHKIQGYCSIDVTNLALLKTAIHLFGSVKLGINLPNDWTCTDCTWGMTGSEIVGGHDVPALGYDTAGIQCATWGGMVTITWEAVQSGRWIEEAYVPLSPDWVDESAMSPAGLDWPALQKALDQAANGTVPDDPPPGPPSPEPPPGPGPGPQPPPAPPPAPPAPPAYDITLSGQLPGLLGAHNVTFTGRAVPSPARAEKQCGGCGGRSFPSLAILAAVLRLIADFGSGAAPEVIQADLEKLLTDLTRGAGGAAGGR